jgi:hypothetical protein
MRDQARKSLAKIRSNPEFKARHRERIKRLSADPEWREKVSNATRNRMRSPEVRSLHLESLEQARLRHGTNFKGGNGQPMTPVQRMAMEVFGPRGFQREFVIRTKGHGTKHRPPTSYKADFANPTTRIVVELDGPAHSLARQEIDKKKTEVLTALGWRVLRIRHGKEVMPAHFVSALEDFS